MSDNVNFFDSRKSIEKNELRKMVNYSVHNKESRLIDKEVLGNECVGEAANSSIIQLVYGSNSLTFNIDEELFEYAESSENDDINLLGSDDGAKQLTEPASYPFSNDLLQKDDNENRFQLVHRGKSLTVRDEDDLIEYAESSENADFDDQTLMRNEVDDQDALVSDDFVEYDPCLTSVDEHEASAVEPAAVVPVVYQGRPNKGRKRKIPDQSRSDRKRLYNTNKMHINTKGNIAEERIFNQAFECVCSKKCTDIVSLERRRRLFNQFWSMGTFAGRCALLINCVSETPKKRSYSKNPMKNRIVTRKYTMFGQTVCKVALLRTLQISQKRIALALNKQNFFDSFADLRGTKSGGANAFPFSKREEVRAHISSFPKYISHYARSQTNAKFLNSNLNLAKMYALYKTDAANPVSKSYYKRVFYEDFNLRFKAPKKDSCHKCDYYAVKIQNPLLTEADRTILEEWHNEHLEQAELLRAEMKANLEMAKIDKLLEVLTFDFQKVLSLARLSTSILYYLRQLNLYNFGIHVGSTGKALFNVWLETEASKGTQEVGSCLRNYIATIDGPKKLILWSDSCGGQNRSIKLVLMLIQILQTHKTLETISIRYLQSGHSFLPNDSEFGDFECALKGAGDLYTDADVIKIMENCRIKNKFVVNRLYSNDFFSVKNLEKEITNRKVDVNKNKINWLDTHEIVMEKSQPGIIKMKKKIDGTFQSVNIEKKGRNMFGIGNVVLDQLWPNGKPLSKEKIKDLQEMLNLVPEEYKEFYSFLNTTESGNFIDDIDGYGESIDFDLQEFLSTEH